MTPIEANKILEMFLHKQCDLKRTEFAYDQSEVWLAVKTAKDALEKQIPKKPIHIHEEYEKHDWKKDKDGNIDDCAWESGYHNGVICNRCSKTVCVFCYEDYDEEAGKCVVDKHYCPNCERHIYKNKLCPGCGQAIDWSDAE